MPDVEVESVRLSDEIAWVDGGDQVVIQLLDDLARSPMLLDGGAADIWRLLAEGLSVRKVVHELADAYDTDPETIAADVQSFLEQSVAVRILTADGIVT